MTCLFNLQACSNATKVQLSITNNNLYFVLDTWDITVHFITYILYSYTKIKIVD